MFASMNEDALEFMKAEALDTLDAIRDEFARRAEHNVKTSRQFTVTGPNGTRMYYWFDGFAK